MDSNIQRPLIDNVVVNREIARQEVKVVVLGPLRHHFHYRFDLKLRKSCIVITDFEKLKFLSHLLIRLLNFLLLLVKSTIFESELKLCFNLPVWFQVDYTNEAAAGFHFYLGGDNLTLEG